MISTQKNGGLTKFYTNLQIPGSGVCGDLTHYTAYENWKFYILTLLEPIKSCVKLSAHARMPGKSLHARCTRGALLPHPRHYCPALCDPFAFAAAPSAHLANLSIADFSNICCPCRIAQSAPPRQSNSSDTSANFKDTYSRSRSTPTATMTAPYADVDPDMPSTLYDPSLLTKPIRFLQPQIQPKKPDSKSPSALWKRSGVCSPHFSRCHCP
jgi:hypothetical protein